MGEGLNKKIAKDGSLCVYGYCISKKDYDENGRMREIWEEKLEQVRKGFEEYAEMNERRKAAQYREHTEFSKWLQQLDMEQMQKFVDYYVFDYLEIDWKQVDEDAEKGELKQGDWE